MGFLGGQRSTIDSEVGVCAFLGSRLRTRAFFHAHHDGMYGVFPFPTSLCDDDSREKREYRAGDLIVHSLSSR